MVSGNTLEEMHLGVTYENKTRVFIVEWAAHALNYLIYSMLFVGAITQNNRYIIPFVAHCIAGISLFLGSTEASFFLGLKCFKDCTWGNCKFTMFSILSIFALVIECVFLTYSRKYYLEVKNTELPPKKELTEQEEGLLFAT